MPDISTYKLITHRGNEYIVSIQKDGTEDTLKAELTEMGKPNVVLLCIRRAPYERYALVETIKQVSLRNANPDLDEPDVMAAGEFGIVIEVVAMNKTDYSVLALSEDKNTWKNKYQSLVRGLESLLDSA